MKKHAWIAFGLLGLAIMASDIILGKVDNKFDFSTFTLVWWPTLGTIFGILMWRPREKMIWFLWLAGSLSFLINNVLSYYDIPPDVTTPSIRDLFALAGYLYFAFALILVVQKREDRRDPIAGLATIIITFGLTTLVYAQVIKELVGDHDDTAFVAQQVAYIVLQMCFVATVVRLYLSSGHHSGTFWLVMAIGATFLVGTFTESEMQAVYASGGEPDFASPAFIILRYIPTFLTYILVGLAPMHPTMWRFGHYKDPKPFTWRWRREIAIVVFVFMPVVVSVYTGVITPLRVLAWLGVLLMILRYWMIGYLYYATNQLVVQELQRKGVNGGTHSGPAHGSR